MPPRLRLQAEWPRAIEELCSFPHIEEAAVLSTCNRMELYCVGLSWHRVGGLGAALAMLLTHWIFVDPVLIIPVSAAGCPGG